MNAVSLEAKFLAKRARLKNERKIQIKEERVSSSSDAKLDTLVKTMERIMDRISLAYRLPQEKIKRVLLLEILISE